MSNATAAALEITIDGQEYSFTPLVFGDYEWLELKLRARAIDAGRQSIPDDATPEQRDMLMEEIFDEARRIEVFSQLADVLKTPVGLVWVLHRMVGKSHPDVTTEDIRQWVMDKELMAEISPKLLALTGLKKRGREEAAPENPKTTNHSVASKS